LSVYGGDVQAGSGFGEGCTASNGSAKIMTFNQGSGNYLGAGTHMAAFALGVITEFASAGGGGGAGPKTLSFSNTSGGTYGGNFGHTYCAPNYWAGAPTSFPAPNLTSPVAEGEHRVVYFNGNVTISSNIAYANDGSWADLSKIPSFYLIVKGGDIYIDKGVTQLDGVYVAMKNGATGGTIYTCTNGGTRYSGTVPDGADAGCGKKLTINGAFIANQVKFLRTRGDVATAAAGELATSGNIAETFIYGPEIWAR
jgi:hypothetical protein